MSRESKYYKADTIIEKTYQRQASDYFQRFTHECGRTIAKKTGHPVFTSFNAWCHAPTLDHPDFKLKIQMGNRAGGSVFSEMTVPEFDEWYKLLGDWRLKFDNEIKIAISNSLELKRRHHIHITTGNILSDTTLPTTPIEQALEEKMTQEFLSKQESIPVDTIKTELISLMKRFKNTDNPIIKDYLYNQMFQLLPTEEQRNTLNLILSTGETPDSIYEDLSPVEPPQIEDVMYSEIPLDIDLSLLYNTQNTPYSDEDTTENEDT